MTVAQVIKLIDVWKEVAQEHRARGNIEKAEFWEDAIEDLEEALYKE